MSTSFGYKGKGASSSDVTNMIRIRAAAANWSQNIKDKGSLSSSDISVFQQTLNTYAEVTGNPITPTPPPPTTRPPPATKLDWSVASADAFSGSSGAHAVAYGDGTFVACGIAAVDKDTYADIYYSTNGVNWSPITGRDYVDRFSIVNTIAYDGNGTWVAGGHGGVLNAVLYSTNGTDWLENYTLPAPSPPNNRLGTVNKVVYGNGKWMAVGVQTIQIMGITASTNASEWSFPVLPVVISPSGDSLNGKLYDVTTDGNNKWVAVGKGNIGGSSNILYSIDGANNWSYALGNPFESGGTGYSVAYGDGKWVAVGSATESVWYSSNASDWLPATGGAFSNGRGNSVVYDGKGMWVAVGSGSNHTSNIWYSSNASNWLPATGGAFDTDLTLFKPIITSGKKVVYSNSLWVAVGFGLSNQHIWQSSDGIVWSNCSGGAFGEGAQDEAGRDIAYGRTTWASVGDGGFSNTIWSA